MSLGLLSALTSTCIPMQVAGATETLTSMSTLLLSRRAVGSSEAKCRADGNCLEKLDVDGALGWNWGGKDRCDAFSDVNCGANGQSSSVETIIPPVPSNYYNSNSNSNSNNNNKVTHVVTMEITIGKSDRQSSGILKMGLYGESNKKSDNNNNDNKDETLSSISIAVQQFLDLCSAKGLITMPLDKMQYDGFEFVTSPVSFVQSLTLNHIQPFQEVQFGLTSQTLTYAKYNKYNTRSSSTTSIPFLPQPKPSTTTTTTTTTADILDVTVTVPTTDKTITMMTPGYIQIPKSLQLFGKNDDEAFATYITITASSSTPTNNNNKLVIGQLMDESSMQLLTRLASSPTQKGFKGILPGQNSGPPLVPVKVTSISIQTL